VKPAEPALHRALAVSVQRFHGSLASVLEAHDTLQPVPRWHVPLDRFFLDRDCNSGGSRRLGFRDPIDPSERRHDIYLTLEEGVFSRRAVELQVSVVDQSGTPLPVPTVTVTRIARLTRLRQDAMLLPSGALADTYVSVLSSKSTSIDFGETVRLAVPPDRLRDTHLRLVCAQCTPISDKRDTVGFAFLPFVTAEGVVIGDDAYKLDLFKLASGSSPPPPQSYLRSQDHLTRLKKETVSVRACWQEAMKDVHGWVLSAVQGSS
jgi:hypothetical protein